LGRETLAAATRAAGSKPPGVVEMKAKTVALLSALGMVLTSVSVYSLTPPGGAPMQRSGDTLTIFRKGSDGRWRLARDANLMAAALGPKK